MEVLHYWRSSTLLHSNPVSDDIRVLYRMHQLFPVFTFAVDSHVRDNIQREETEIILDYIELWVHGFTDKCTICIVYSINSGGKTDYILNVHFTSFNIMFFP